MSADDVTPSDDQVQAAAEGRATHPGEPHTSGTAGRLNWLRAAVLGANDGIVSVAGIVISGVKFHGRLDPRAFTAEVIALARRVFVASDVEEVDMWATVPIALTSHARAPNGEYLAPEARTVYAVTVLRRERASFAQRLKRGDDVFWDPGWRRSLTAP